MAHARSLPGQRCLFPPAPAAEVLASLREWTDGDLLHLVRSGAYELIRRGLPVPLSVGVVEVAYPMEGVRLEA